MRLKMAFDLKEELKKVNEASKSVADPKARKAMIESETKRLNDHADMLRKMSKFVNAKNKNGMK